jgi:hypothetical protein
MDQNGEQHAKTNEQKRIGPVLTGKFTDKIICELKAQLIIQGRVCHGC